MKASEGPPALILTPMTTPDRMNGSPEQKLGSGNTEHPQPPSHHVIQSQTSLSLTLSLRELTIQTLSGSLRAWLVVVGIAAFFDFAATVLAELLPDEKNLEESRNRKLFFLPRRKSEFELMQPDEHWIVESLRWLDDYSLQIGILFSVLWFIDAFVKASWRRDEKLRELDRERLLNTELKEHQLDGAQWKGAWGPYYRTIGIQLILLPVGFYILVWHILRVLSGNSKEEDDEEFDVVFMDEDGHVEEEHKFTTHSNPSLIFALAQYVLATTLRVTGTRLKARLRKFQWKTVRRLARSAVRNPRSFRRRVLKVLTVMRWFTYLAPLLGACNKLFGNVVDLLKKYRQHLLAVKAQRARYMLWKKLTPEERREKAAIVIQSQWRAHRSRKIVTTLRIMNGEQTSLAATRVQRIARGMLARARAKLMRKRYELQKLHEQEITMMKTDQVHLSLAKRRRMYKLQEELKLEAEDLVNRKLLLRPNTRFAVAWKILFVVCIILEIAQLAWKPTLSKYRDRVTHEPLGIGEILEQKLVPTPLAERDECEVWLKKPSSKSPTRRQRKLDRKKKSVPRAWYCQEPYNTAQWAYIELLRILLTDTLLIVGIVCYLDVFVTFFTGEIDSDTGSLLPKPFFPRWLLPGLTLQMLVNPKMATTSHYLGLLLHHIAHIGPVRVWRWVAALFFPLFNVIVFGIEHYIWLPLVYRHNKAIQK